MRTPSALIGCASATNPQCTGSGARSGVRGPWTGRRVQDGPGVPARESATQTWKKPRTRWSGASPRCDPNRIRTGVAAVRGRSTRPLYDGAAGVPGLEPRMTVPETVVLPITPYPTVSASLRREPLGPPRIPARNRLKLYPRPTASANPSDGRASGDLSPVERPVRRCVPAPRPSPGSPATRTAVARPGARRRPLAPGRRPAAA